MDEVRVCQEIFLTFPQCSCSSSLNSLLEFAEGQEKSDLGIFSQTVYIFSSREEQAENSIPMVPLANLEVAQTNLTQLLGKVKAQEKSQLLEVCIIDKLT